MKLYGWVALFAIVAIGVQAQEKARVFVGGQATISASGKKLGILGSKSAGSPSDDAVEFGKVLEEDCPDIAVTTAKGESDYTITFTRASAKKDGNVRSGGQVRVANPAGKSVGTNFLHTSGNAAKDACELIAADWKHGKTQEASKVQPDPPTKVNAPPAAGHEAPMPGTISVMPRLQTGSSTGVAAGGSGPGEDLGEASRRAKQHADCLKSARENPNITCK